MIRSESAVVMVSPVNLARVRAGRSASSVLILN